MKREKDPKKIFKKFCHVGVVVKDLGRTLDTLTNVFGIGPFKIVDFPPKGTDEDIEMTYYGKPADFTAKFCFAKMGDIELEIIQPISGKSVWFDFLEKHGEGIHHLKYEVPDLEETKQYLNEYNLKMIQSGSAVGVNKGKTWAYFGTEDKAGFVIEVLNELHPKRKNRICL
jgi:hypothetical protein